MRRLLQTSALLALFPYLGIVYLLVTGTASWSSFAYVVAIGALLGGLATLPDPARKSGRRRGLSRGAVLALATVALVRAFVAGDGRRLRVDGAGGEGLRPRTSTSRLVNRLLDEGDVAVAGTRVLVASGMVRDDVLTLPSAMTDAYRNMRRYEGEAPSPFVATYLGLERPDAFDLVLVEAPRTGETTASPRTALLFLHGYAGNFDLPCGQLACAVASTGVVTACPSTRWVGDWWSADGEAILRRTVEILHARGVDRIVLAGLSNGGYGASRLAPRMKGTFAGLVTLDAGHFAMLVRGEESDRAVREFVAARVETRASR